MLKLQPFFAEITFVSISLSNVGEMLIYVISILYYQQ